MSQAPPPPPTHRALAASWWLVPAPLLAALVFLIGDRLPGVAVPSAAAFVGAVSASAIGGAWLGDRPGRAGWSVAGIGLALIALGLGAWTGLACGVIAGGARLGARYTQRHMPALPSARLSRALWALGLILTLANTGRLGVFLADHEATWGSFSPFIEQVVRHSCLTSYAHSLALIAADGDPYDPVYDPPDLDLDAPLPPTAAELAPFTLDMFGYTPAFLVSIRLLMFVAADFLVLRALFPLLSVALWLLTLWWTARHLGGASERRILWLAPLTASAPPLYLSLQFGNASVALACLCALAWLGLRRDRPVAAGALVAFATLTRYMPALLAILIVLRLQWRAMLGGVLGTAGFVGASLAMFGTAPWLHFFETLLPQMASGDVMRFLDDNAQQIAVNAAPFSLPFKLSALGLGDWGWAEGKAINRGFTALLLGLTLWAARARGDDRHDLLRWSAIAALGGVATSFAGPHVMVGALYVLLVLCGEVRGRLGWAGFVAAWLLLVVFPLPLPEGVLLVGGILQTLVLVGLLVWLVVRRPRAA